MTTRDGRDGGSWDDADDQLAESTGNYSAIIDAFDSYTVARGDDSNLDDFDPFAGSQRSVDDGDDLDALTALEASDVANGDGEGDPPVVSATNPRGSVTVTAHLTGAVQRIDLGPAVTSSTELELANEIRAVADVASKKASSMMHAVGVELLTAQGLDRDAAKEYVTEISPFANPEQARAAEANLLARHNGTAD